MRAVTYESLSTGQARVGFILDGFVYGLAPRGSMLDLLKAGSLVAAADEAVTHPAEVIALRDARLLAPIPVPPSVRDFMSFENHVVTSMEALGRTVDPAWYRHPVFYFTNPAAIVGPSDDVPVPPGSLKFDFELEIAAVVGKRGQNIQVDAAEAYIAGYTILCDWSARDLQEEEMSVGLGPAKGKDTVTSLGPVLVSPDELEPFRTERGYDLAMTVTVNGMPYSAGNWSSLYWTFPQMIAYASRGTELREGDVIGSGTVGTGCILELERVYGGAKFPWLLPGDHVELAVDLLGVIAASVVSGSDLVDL